jgi:hypothetical protein
VLSFSFLYLTPIPSFSEIRGLGGFEQATGSFHKEDRFHKPVGPMPKPRNSWRKPDWGRGFYCKQDFLILTDCVVKNVEAWPKKAGNGTERLKQLFRSLGRKRPG